jgi:hypothetical protein
MREDPMRVSQQYLERCAEESGFQVGTLEKVIRLGELAGDVTRHGLLGRVLLLKGGTPLNLCFGAPARLSVDLDFNYIGHVERERMLEYRPEVEAAMVELARRSGYRVQRSADAFAGRKLFLVYRSVLGPDDRIEVDLNFIFRVPLDGVDVRSLWQPGELDRPRVRVVGPRELLIGKILALLDRGAARDAWDVAHLPESLIEVLGSPVFRARFIALAAVLDRPLGSYDRRRLENGITDLGIVERLAPVLAQGTIMSASEIVDRAWTRVQHLLVLSVDEGEYLEGVHRGMLRAEILFPDDPAEAARIVSHPALQWKIQNVREHVERQARGQRKN